MCRPKQNEMAMRTVVSFISFRLPARNGRTIRIASRKISKPQCFSAFNHSLSLNFYSDIFFLPSYFVSHKNHFLRLHEKRELFICHQANKTSNGYKILKYFCFNLFRIYLLLCFFFWFSWGKHTKFCNSVGVFRRGLNFKLLKRSALMGLFGCLKRFC